MRRRDFLSILGGATAVWPRAARAQSDRVRRIGVLSGLADGDPEAQGRIAAFRDGLRKLGWVDGRNIRIDYRWGSGDADRLRSSAVELAGTTPDVILAAATPALAALRQATRTVPIVFAQVSDPVAAGFVVSVAHPGGNITGFATYEYGGAVKWLELLKEIAPSVSRVTVIYDPAQPSSIPNLRELETGVRAFGVQISIIPIRDAAAIDRALESIAAEPNGGLIVLAGPIVTSNRERVIELAAKHRVPAVYGYRFYVTGGGLASYGVDNLDLYRGAATYVDRIFKGEKPGDLPVQFSTKYELVINLKTAKALGLDPPIALLARTDEVIE